MRLDDIVVLDLTQLLPGAYATQLLADMGATVVKIEPPAGDPLRQVSVLSPDDGVFTALTRGKESVVLDLKRDRGQEALETLVSDADVVLTGFRSGVAERLGADYETLTDHRDDLVYCSVSGYGNSGPSREQPGHDLTFVGESGFLDLCRRSRSERPTLPPFSIADMAGGLFAAFSVTSALLARERDGDGTYIDVAMLDVLLSFAQTRAPEVLAGNEPAPPGPFTGTYPCYDVYETADERYVTLAAFEPKFWDQFCDRVDRADLRDAHLSEDAAVREALREELTDLFETRTRAEWLDCFADADTTLAPVNTLSEALSDPQIRHREMVLEDRLGFPARTDPPVEPATETAPDLGEDTRAILSNAGYTTEEIDAIVDSY